MVQFLKYGLGDGKFPGFMGWGVESQDLIISYTDIYFCKYLISIFSVCVTVLGLVISGEQNRQSSSPSWASLLVGRRGDKS